MFTYYIACAAIYNDDADDNNDAGDDLKNQNTLLLQRQKQQYEGRTSRHYFLAVAVAAVVINGWFSFRTLHRCVFSLAMLLSLSDEHLMLLFLVSASRPALSRPAPHCLLPVLRDLRLRGAAGFVLHWCCFCRDVVGNVQLPGKQQQQQQPATNNNNKNNKKRIQVYFELCRPWQW